MTKPEPTFKIILYTNITKNLVAIIYLIFLDLYQERIVVWQEQERCKQEEEKLKQEKEIRRSIQEKERREIDKTMIERYRRNQNEIRGQNKFLLEKELRKKVSYFCYFSLSFEKSYHFLYLKLSI